MTDPRDIARTGSSSLVSRADRRRQLVAFAAISGLVLLAFGMWFVAILTSSDRDQLEIAEGPPPAAEQPDGEEDDEDEGDDEEEGVEGDEALDDGTTGEEASVEEPDRGAPDVTTEERFDPEPDTDVDAESDADPEPGTDDTENADDTANADDADVEHVTIDGVCTVELDAVARDAAPLRAWEYADCAYAPVSLDDGGERWIVVRASMASGDFDAATAQERARDLGVDGGVLWSSHYPSLTPDLWVAYDGPFPDAEAARNAADAVDTEAYARALTPDPDDR